MQVRMTLLGELQGHSADIWDVRVSPDGQWLASASMDGTVCMWDTARLSLIKHLPGNKPTYIEFSPDGRVLATSSKSSGVSLWRQDGSLASELKCSQTQPEAVVFSPDGQFIAAGFASAGAAVWSPSGALLAELDHAGSAVTRLCFSPDGRYLLTGDGAGQLRLWEVGVWRHLLTFGASTASGPGAAIHFVAFTRDAQTIIARRRTDLGDVQIWHLQPTGVALTGTLIQKPNYLACNPHVARFAPLLSLAIERLPLESNRTNSPRSVVNVEAPVKSDPDQADMTSAVLLYNTQTLKPLRELIIPNDMAIQLLFTAQDRLLITGGAAGEVWLWDTQTWQHVGGFAAHTEAWDYREGAPVYALCGLDSTPDGRLLATAGLEPDQPTTGPYGGPVRHIVKLWHIDFDASH